MRAIAGVLQGHGRSTEARVHGCAGRRHGQGLDKLLRRRRDPATGKRLLIVSLNGLNALHLSSSGGAQRLLTLHKKVARAAARAKVTFPIQAI